MKQVHVKVRENWSHCNSTFARGYAYVGNELYMGDALARYFEPNNVEEFKSKLRKAQGFFAVVHADDNGALLAVDHIASYQLFLGSSGKDVYVSDDAYWVAEQLKENQYERLAAVEFLLSGTVSGHDTLFPRVKRVPPGEMLLIRVTHQEAAIAEEQYYDFIHHDFFTEEKESLLERLDTSITASFERLVRSVNGRTIALSLSAGYDSRLVAMMLKKLNYRNVICFNYGRPGNRESRISRGVAKQLGFPWEFIPYSTKLWFEWFHSEERKSCVKYADGLTTCPWVQDWPAVSKMKEQATIPENSVIVQGHGGDILAGHLATIAWTNHALSLESLLDLVQQYFYWDPRRLGLDQCFSESTESLLTRVRDKTRALFVGMPCGTLQDGANAFDHYMWKHRLPMRTMFRGHEFFGYDWRAPLWDPLAVTFWTRVPLQHRFGEQLYVEFVERTERKLGVSQPVRSGSVPYPQGYQFMRILHATRLAEPLAKSGVMNHAFGLSGRIRSLSYKKVYDHHHFAWYGIVSKERYGQLHSSGAKNLYAILAAERLGLLSL